MTPVDIDSPRRAETILVVDDEDLMRTFVCRLLNQWGYQVLSAATSLQAIDLCRDFHERIDLLLTDVMLATINGLQLAARIRADSARSSMGCLFMSGYQQDSLVERGVLRRTDAFIQKPFTPSALAQMVRDSLDHSCAAH